MITGLDHIVVVVADIASATSAYQTLLGRRPAWRSTGEGAATVLFTLPNMTLELMSAVGDGEAAERIRAAQTVNGDGLASLCFRVDDIDGMHRRLTRLGLGPEAITAGGSTDAESGAGMTWRRTRAATAAAHGVRLFFLQTADARPLSEPAGDAPVLGLDHVVVASQNPDRAAALYGARLGLDMALDRAHPDWGRLMFFRCGDLIVEVVQRPGQTDPSADDRLWGLSWRVADADAARARLVAAGVAVSEVRAGRKPGTRVASLKSGTAGVPTLLLERSAR